MPKITDVSYQSKNKNRCNVFVDDEFFAGISLETVIKCRIKVGQEVDVLELERLLIENDRSEALSKAADYVSKSLKTKRQVKDYLLKKGYSEQTVWYCVDKLKEYSYIDDEEYSRRYIESVSKNQGKKLVEYKLMQKGVKKEDIASAYSQVEIDFNANTKLVLEKYLKNKEINKETIAKAYRYLVGKGFNYDDINSAISEYDKGD